MLHMDISPFQCKALFKNINLNKGNVSSHLEKRKKTMKSNLYLILLSSLLVNVCQGLYFHIGETERKCFIEEIPDETTVIGDYDKRF